MNRWFRSKSDEIWKGTDTLNYKQMSFHEDKRKFYGISMLNSGVAAAETRLVATLQTTVSPLLCNIQNAIAPGCISHNFHNSRLWLPPYCIAQQLECRTAVIVVAGLKNQFQCISPGGMGPCNMTTGDCWKQCQSRPSFLGKLQASDTHCGMPGHN